MGLTPASSHQQNHSGLQSSMESSNSPLESIISSACAVREAFSPMALESMVQGAAKDLESGFLMVKQKAHRKKQKMEITDGVQANKQNLDPSMNNFLFLEEPKKDSAIKFPLKAVWGNIFQNASNKSRKTESTKKNLSQTNVVASKMQISNEETFCGNCFLVAVTRTFLGSFLQAIPNHFKTVKKCFGKHTAHATGEMKTKEINVEFVEKTGPFLSIQLLANKSLLKNTELHPDGSFSVNVEKSDSVKEKDLSFEVFFNYLLEYCLQTGLKLQQDKKQEQKECINEKNARKEPEVSSIMDIGRKPSFLPDFKGMDIFHRILKGNKVDKDGLVAKLRFARIGGASEILVDSTTKEEIGGQANRTIDAESNHIKKAEANPAQKLTTEIFNASLTNVERLKTTLSAIPLAEVKERLHQIGKSQDYPDLKQLFSFQHVFDYAQTEGRKFFEELDRDGDGRVTLEDLEVAMRKRRLPRHYAHELLRRTRTHMFAKSFGWEQFLSLMKQKEPTIVSAYVSLSLSKYGTLKKSQVLTTLKSQGLPATEENVVAMMRILNADTEGVISYGHFHNFMLLLPPEHLQDDPWSLWFKAATVVAGAPPIVIPAGNVLRAALVGGLTCAMSTSLMHPIDTIKTRVQASTLSFLEVASKVPQIGTRALYRGSIPAIWGQFTSHGLRTGIFETSKFLLTNVAPTLTEIQVQSLSSFTGTVLGTAVRTPCEVLKQRLQVGMFDNVGAAIIGTWKQDGLKGFFRGAGAMLFREVPFYVAGMGLYAESTKVAQRLANRELAPWEIIAVGALSGGLAAVLTTPFDVMKTRMMTSPPGEPTTIVAITFTILKQDGPFGLFKGAVPRFFWIAPLGAMNFAGYELARKAMDKADDNADEVAQEKKLVKAG